MKETARTLCFQAVIITNKNTHINTTPLQKPLLNNHDDCVCCLLDIITSNLVVVGRLGFCSISKFFRPTPLLIRL